MGEEGKEAVPKTHAYKVSGSYDKNYLYNEDFCNVNHALLCLLIRKGSRQVSLLTVF